MHEAWVWVWYELLDWMINGCTEKHFDLDSVKYKSTISTNKKKQAKWRLPFNFRYLCSFLK